MDQKTLIVSCVEYYSHLKNIPGDKVFHTFEKATILSMILDSHQIFPDMDVDFYIGMIDGISAMESDADHGEYAQYAQRIPLISEVVARLADTGNMDIPTACHTYYYSKTAELVSEDHTEYYKKSVEEILALLDAE